MNLLNKICLLLGFCCWFFANGGANATMGGATTVGPVGTGSDAGGFSREWVQLEKQGTLLIGVPQNGPLKLIVVYAPQADDGHIILRWANNNDGKTPILLVAPDELAEKIQRASLYFERTKAAKVLYENLDSGWTRRDPQFITLSAEPNSVTSNELLNAYSVKGLGSYWLVQPASSSAGSANSSTTLPPENPILNGSILRAGSNWALAFLLLAVAYYSSRRSHRNNQRRGH